MGLRETADENMRMLRSPLWWVIVIFFSILSVAGLESYKQWCEDGVKEYEKKQADRKFEEFKKELKEDLNKGYDFSVGQTSDTEPDFPEWSDCGGDYKACRELFLKNIETINTDSKYRNWAYIVHPEIKGDELWLYSMHFKEHYIRDEVTKNLERMFKDCHFTKVKAAITRYEGQGYWVIWSRDSSSK